MKGNRRPGKDQGSAAVEFALVLPVLMLVLFGIIDFGRMLNARIILNQAAHEGARAAAVRDPDAADEVIDKVLGSLVAERDIQSCAPGDSDGYAQVALTHQFSFVTPLFGSGMTLTATAAVPCLR